MLSTECVSVQMRLLSVTKYSVHDIPHTYYALYEIVLCCIPQQDGVFKTQCNGSFEQTMKSMTFHQPGQTKTKQKSPQKNLTKDRVILPPLIHKPKVQGPFRTPEDVWKQRHKPLNPTLSVSTPYNSEEIARLCITLMSIT